MALGHARRGKQAQPSDRPEDQAVRQYRFLLRTAPQDALEAAHVDALSAIGPQHRETVLRTVQAQLVAGAHLHADDVKPLAHLMTLGERRSPGVLTSSIPDPALSELARALIDSEPAFGLFGGYAEWDGVDPTAPEEHDDSEYGEHWHTVLGTRDGSAPGLNGAFGGT